MTLAEEQSVRHIAGLVRASDRHSEEIADIRHVMTILHDRLKSIEKDLESISKKVKNQRQDINKLFIGHPNL